MLKYQDLSDIKLVKLQVMSSKKKLSYSKILLKLSGEALQGSQGYGIDNITLVLQHFPDACPLPSLSLTTCLKHNF